MSLKVLQTSLQKTITWITKLKRGHMNGNMFVAL
jgi:hypothetical protein